jgi:hypothetical protein
VQLLLLVVVVVQCSLQKARTLKITSNHATFTPESQFSVEHDLLRMKASSVSDKLSVTKQLV